MSDQEEPGRFDTQETQQQPKTYPCGWTNKDEWKMSWARSRARQQRAAERKKYRRYGE